MYQISKESNDIIKLEERLFGELGFKERENLQEWIAKNPDVLGEELLIIQKEYDGFNDTNERLDLLALDKKGNLVIIENKLDDTGRDVVWQALKYTSYCSTLKTTLIIKMYQEYLDRYENVEEDAKSLILEFLEIEEDTLLLNGDDQRMLFVANHYRKEVTSTVLWLLDHDIQVQCFKATPYSMGEELFLQMDQIIPQPEMEEYRIDAKEKEKEDKGKSKTVLEGEANAIAFWQLVKDKLDEKNIHYFDNVSVKPRNSMVFWKGQARFAMVLGKEEPRVEIYFMHDADKTYFDNMATYQDELGSKFHGDIIWQRMDDKKASRIKYEMPYEQYEKIQDWNNKEVWDAWVYWLVDEIEKFYAVFYPVWDRVKKELDSK